MLCPECGRKLVRGSGAPQGVPPDRWFCSNEACDNEETYPVDSASQPITNLRCTKCNVTIDRCNCLDIDIKLKRDFFQLGCHLLAKWCPTCDKHFARCKCEPPKFVIVSGGVILSDEKVAEGFMNGEGNRVFVDLYSR